MKNVTVPIPVVFTVNMDCQILDAWIKKKNRE